MSVCKFSVFYENDVLYPFQAFIASLLQKNLKLLTSLCTIPYINICSLYAGLFGILGMTLSFFDIVRIVKSGPVLPQTLLRSRIQGKIVSSESERDFKLISLVVSLEFYTYLTIGALTRQPLLFLPWLILSAFVISLEFVVFICRLFVRGFTASKHGLLLSMFLVYNWLSIFCTFFSLFRGC